MGAAGAVGGLLIASAFITGDDVELAEILAGVSGVALGVGILAALTRRLPDQVLIWAFWGLPRRDRWAVFRAMWSRSPLDDARLLPFVEAWSSSMKRAQWGFLVLLGGAAWVTPITAGDGAWWIGALFLLVVVALGVQAVFVAVRGRLVVRLTRERASTRALGNPED